MKKTVTYVDRNFAVVRPSKARFLVETVYDDKGHVVEETVHRLRRRRASPAQP